MPATPATMPGTNILMPPAATATPDSPKPLAHGTYAEVGDCVVDAAGSEITSILIGLYIQHHSLKPSYDIPRHIVIQHAEHMRELMSGVSDLLKVGLESATETGKPGITGIQLLKEAMLLPDENSIVQYVNDFIDRDQRQILRFALLLEHLIKIEDMIIERGTLSFMTETVWRKSDGIFRMFMRRYFVFHEPAGNLQ
jgi:hypothetical protein